MSLPNLNEARERLERLAREKAALENFIKASEELAVMTPEKALPTVTHRNTMSHRKRTPSVRDDSFRGIVFAVLADKQKPMKVDAIWEGAKERGAHTKTDPTRAVRFALNDMKKQGLPVQRVDTNTWRAAAA